MTQNKRLPYLIYVDVDDHGDCQPLDIGEGIQHGIDMAMDAGSLTRSTDTSTIIKGITTLHQLIDPALTIDMLMQVERWMSGYGTTSQPEMRQKIRDLLAELPNDSHIEGESSLPHM